MTKHFAPPTFGLDNRMTVVLFAGMGGGCDGLEDAGFHVHLAINHDPVAVAVHQKRHPHVRHLRCDVFEVDPRDATRGRGVRVLHASPDCTHFSVAKGGKPVSKRRRSLAWVVCRWAGQVRPETITLENVPEIQTWGGLVAKRDPETGRVLKLDGSIAAKGERVPVQEQWLIPDPRKRGQIWRAWLLHMERLGYHFEGKVLVCADYGVPTIRKRFFGVAQLGGAPIIWPERTHAPRDKADALGLRPWVGAHTIIDWSRPVRSIFGRKKQSADATLRRVANGIMRYVVTAAKPFMVPITHGGGANRAYSIDNPVMTLTTANRGELSVVVPHMSVLRNAAKPFYSAEDPTHAFTAGGAHHMLVEAELAPFTAGAGGRAAQSEPRSMEEPTGSSTTKEDRVLVAATMVQTGYGEREGQAPRALDIEEPVGTQVAGGCKAAIVAAFLAQHNNDSRRLAGVHPGRDAEEPVATLTMQPQVGVVAASMLALRGSNKDGRDIAEPTASFMAGGNHAGLILAFLQHYYSNGKQGDDLHSPLAALTAKARHGLVTATVGRKTMVMADIGMRMLEPEEGAAAHGFKRGALPDTIVINGRERRLTKTEKYHLVGNSVPPRMVQLLAECNVRREFAEAAE